MPSVLAIISQAVFAKLAPKGVAVGDVLDVDRYTSNHAAFAQLGRGDAIFVVTVRPPDERLWLVAILEEPERKASAWVAAGSTTTIADISSAIRTLKFASGTGITAKQGALGMSLQTPRVLTAEDVALLRAGRTKAKRKATSKQAQPPAIKLVRVRGGTFWMGFTIDDIHAVFSAFDEPAELADQFERSRPIREVTITPFEVAPTQATAEDESDDDDAGVSAKHALAAVAAAGGRLPSEEEWEWIAREGGAVRFTSVPRAKHPLTPRTAGSAAHHGPNGFGVGDLLRPERVGPNGKLARFGHIWFQEDSEVVGLHAAYRSTAEDDASYRIARALPGAKPPKPVRLALPATMQRTLVGLRGKTPGPSIRTIEALLAMKIHDDTRLLLDQLAASLPQMKSGKDDLLRVLADAAERPAIKKLLVAAKLPIAEPASPIIPAIASAPLWATTGFTAARLGATTARGPRGKVKERWSIKLGASVTGAVVGGDGTVFVGDGTGRVHAVSAAGKKLWSHKAKGAILSTPAIDARGTIWVGRAGPKLYGYPPNGDVDAAEVIHIGSPHTSPAIGPDGTLYIATKAGTLFAVRDRAIVWRYPGSKRQYPPLNAPTVGADGMIYEIEWGGLVHAISPAGKKRWVIRPTQHGSITAWPIAMPDGSSMIGFANTGVTLLDAKGALQRSFGLADGDRAEALSVDSKGNVYVASHTSAACVFVHGRTGKQLRQLQANNWIYDAVTLDADDVAYFGSLMNLYAYDAKGKLLWHARARGRTTSPVIGSDGTLYITTDQGYLQAYR